MNILAIGNSFSQDATRYLHQIAEADGAYIKVVNLYIGGCSLRTHYINALEDRKNYMIEFNGQSIGFMASIKEALISDIWDVVTVQQVSHQSTDYASYQPYLGFLSEYIEKYSPEAEIYVHQTWAYERDSEKLCKLMGYSDPAVMQKDIERAYASAARDIGAAGLIPSGELFERLLRNGIPKLHRDTFHASLGLGRYALGLLWYAVLTGSDISNNAFIETDEPVTAEEISAVKLAVNELTRQGNGSC